jgi:hypothetical protein
MPWLRSSYARLATCTSHARSGPFTIARKRQLIYAATALLCLAFKPSTHIHTTDRALDLAATLDLFDRSYPKDPHVRDAIRAFPDYYRGGVVGPDAFPDILFGQGQIHPDTRCDNGKATCGESGTFTHQWLTWVFERGWSEYRRLSTDGDLVQAQQILAFTYGFLAHAAGDLWGHTLVNGYSKGIFPSITAMANPAVAKIAARHVVVEGYIGLHTPSSVQLNLNAPIPFVRRTFIRDGNHWGEDPCSSDPDVPTSLANGSHFDTFLANRRDLCTFIEGLDTGLGFEDIAECALLPPPGCVLDEGGSSLVKAYAIAWVNDIDEGLDEWPYFSRDLAQDLFMHDDYDAAFERAKTFGLSHVLAMLGVPDAVGEGYLKIQNVGQVASDVLTHVPGYVTLKGWIDTVKTSFLDLICQQAFGMSYSEWKAYVTDPAAHIADENIGLDAGVRDQLNSVMMVEQGSDVYSIAQFATFANTRVLTGLSLLAPKTLDSLLFDLHVGKLYTGTRIAAKYPEDILPAVKQNVMLGFVRSIDANHAWSSRSPDHQSGSTITVSEGMPLWRDCLARERAFRKLFLNSVHLDVHKNFDICLIIADPLPPMTFLVPASQEQPPIVAGCFVALTPATVINHLDSSEPYFLYLRVWEGAGPERKLIHHRVLHDTLSPMSSATHDLVFPGSCEEGVYDAEAFLFRWMSTFDVEDTGENWQHPRRAPYFAAAIASPQTFQFQIRANSADCPLVTSPIFCPGPTGGEEFCGLERPVTPCAKDANGNVISTVRPPLDADGDEVPDAADNCPTIANEDQVDSNGDRAGDACEPPISEVRFRDFPRKRNFFDDPRIFTAFQRLQGIQPRRPPVDCLTCPNSEKGFASVVNALAAENIGKKQGFSEFTRGLGELLGSTYVKGYGVDVQSFKLSDSADKVIIKGAAPRGGKLVVGLSSALVAASEVEVIIAGKQSKLAMDHGVIVVDLPPRATSVEVLLPQRK